MSADDVTASEIRAWYRSRGIDVPPRGVMARKYIQGWNRAHPDRPFIAERRNSTYYGTLTPLSGGAKRQWGDKADANEGGSVDILLALAVVCIVGGLLSAGAMNVAVLLAVNWAHFVYLLPVALVGWAWFVLLRRAFEREGEQ